jgi:hypothetical protein
LKWVSKTDAARYPSVLAAPKTAPQLSLVPAPSKIDMKKIAHPKTLEERVTALEHELQIFAQVFIGKAPDNEGAGQS